MDGNHKKTSLKNDEAGVKITLKEAYIDSFSEKLSFV
jgi:hypothetical protein